MSELSRRSFLAVGATAVAASVRDAVAQASRYDLVISGGRVIDPASRLDGVRDVAIAGGRVAAVSPKITAASAATIDARGKLVIPGLIDIHTHAARSADGPPLLLKDGVTGWIDAGSQGADHIADVIGVARSSPQASDTALRHSAGQIEGLDCRWLMPD